MALPIRTKRLCLRALDATDAPRIAEIGGHPDVARMIMAATSPWSVAEAAAWIGRMAWQDRLGFALGVERDGRLIGAVGCGGEPLSLFFWFDPDCHGRGFATEAAGAVLDFVHRRYGVKEITADHFEDNPGSGAVLRKLGFVEMGREPRACSRARAEPAPAIQYRWQAGASLAEFALPRE